MDRTHRHGPWHGGRRDHFPPPFLGPLMAIGAARVALHHRGRHGPGHAGPWERRGPSPLRFAVPLMAFAAARAALHRSGRRGPGPFGPGGQFPFGPFGGFPGFPGGPFRRGPRARRGDIRAGILALLAEGPRNGYQIIQELGQRSGGIWRASPGSVYPALEQLQDEGLVRAEQLEGKRTFQLTDAGRAYVEEHREEIAAPWEAMAEGADPRTLELGGLIAQVGLAAMQVVHTGTEAQVTEARQILKNARRALYRILAEDEPGEAKGTPGGAGRA